jgi:hypothetical protein
VQSYTVTPLQRTLQPKDQERLTAAIRRAGFESSQEQEKMLNILLQNPASMEYDSPLSAPFFILLLSHDVAFMSSEQMTSRIAEPDVD